MWPPTLLRSPQGKLAVLLSLGLGFTLLSPGLQQLHLATGYLPLHAFAETISIIFGCIIFALTWESRAHRSQATLLLASAFLAAALFDFCHLLSYQGMPDFITANGMQKAGNFRLAGRLTTLVALLAFALRSSKPQAASPTLAKLQLFATLGCSILICWLLLTLSDNISLPGGIGTEIAFICLNGLTALMLARRFARQRHPFDGWLATSAWVMGLAEIFLSFSSNPGDLPGLFSHAYKIAAYLFAYRALITHIVRQPYPRLAAEASRSRSIFETSLDGIHLIDMRGKVIDANPAFAAMLGYTCDEIRELRVTDFEAGKSPAEMANILEQMRRGQAHTLFETKLRRKDGNLIDAEVAINLARLPEDEFLVVAVRNLADRKAKDHLKLAGEVFQHAHVGLLITDAEGKIIELNPMTSEITGYCRDELIGQTPAILKSGTHEKEFYADLWNSLLHKGFWSGEICNRRKGGELYHELLSITAIHDNNGAEVNYLAVFSDITRRKSAEEEMRRIAHFDALTGLPNRLLLADRLEQAIAQNQRSNKQLAVCFLDLDGFKQINDSLGHETGDLLLKEVAIRLLSMVRGSDTVARLGGDEFVLLISGLNSEDECSQTLKRVLQSVSTPYTLVGDSLSEISASIGVTLYPADASDADTLVRHADHAMYAAKQAGKNCFQLFDAHMEQRLQARQDTLRRVARGLTTGQFLLHYQPKLDCRRNAVVGVEALIRWNHPILGLLTPSEFLPLLEDDDLALALGEWVFREALRQGHRWQQQGLDLTISVNAFPRQLQRQNFVEVLSKAVRETWPELPPGKFIIEITETAALNELESIQKSIGECRMLGIGFSLDDFGTGYSSLTYLRQLTVDELKIDLSFVRNMLTDNEDLSIINGLIGLGQAFKLQVVAEGVETDAHIGRLLELGCDIMQGFAISQPIPADQLETWLRQFPANSIRS